MCVADVRATVDAAREQDSRLEAIRVHCVFNVFVFPTCTRRWTTGLTTKGFDQHHHHLHVPDNLTTHTDSARVCLQERAEERKVARAAEEAARRAEERAAKQAAAAAYQDPEWVRAAEAEQLAKIAVEEPEKGPSEVRGLLPSNMCCCLSAHGARAPCARLAAQQHVLLLVGAWSSRGAPGEPMFGKPFLIKVLRFDHVQLQKWCSFSRDSWPFANAYRLPNFPGATVVCDLVYKF